MRKGLAKKTAVKGLCGIAVFWLFCSLLLLILSQALSSNLSNIKALRGSVVDFRSTIHFTQPIRTSQFAVLKNDTENIHYLRYKLEQDFRSTPFQPDIHQLLYLTELFLENSNQFMSIEEQVSGFIYQLKSARLADNTSQQARRLYYQLATCVFETLYTPSSSKVVHYREFDRILTASQSLNDDDAIGVQKRLAEATRVLSDYAQVNYLVEQLVDHDLYAEIAKIDTEFARYQQYYLWIALAVSLLALASSSLLVIKITRLDDLADDKGTVTIKQQSGSKAQHQVEQTNRSDSQSGSTFKPEAVSSVIEESQALTEDIELTQSVETALSTEVVETSNTSQDSVVEASSDALKATILDTDYMLETFDNDAEAVNMLLGIFIQDHTNDHIALQQQLDEKDVETAQRTAHSLKGVSSTLGAEQLKLTASDIEITLKNGQPVTAEQISCLADDLAKTMDAVKVYLAKK
ncbi:hypothetical protein BCU68_16235 [Vibrio sp. 10N.286.49.B3]|uniref:Hpt domain-containing protein n=1 Tax=Vibrio sp. 10N.286.49.B3 TaxID=1880855 RepID=UPI000CB65704|nr:Hpt domain-containing protein [Vibrio sp. 10N.286.49.B3]PMH40606.1 hypothetical protein BCU68_16235 [Vibrio sp. 10N.286.49.B3]